MPEMQANSFDPENYFARRLRIGLESRKELAWEH
jgi:hypothetical protein